MNSVTLEYTVVTNPDSFVGFKYYVKAGQAFDADDFAYSYKLNRSDLDPDSMLATREALCASPNKVPQCFKLP